MTESAGSSGRSRLFWRGRRHNQLVPPETSFPRYLDIQQQLSGISVPLPPNYPTHNHLKIFPEYGTCFLRRACMIRNLPFPPSRCGKCGLISCDTVIHQEVALWSPVPGTELLNILMISPEAIPQFTLRKWCLDGRVLLVRGTKHMTSELDLLAPLPIPGVQSPTAGDLIHHAFIMQPPYKPQNHRSESFQSRQVLGGCAPRRAQTLNSFSMPRSIFPFIWLFICVPYEL